MADLVDDLANDRTCTDRPQPSCSRPDGTPLRAWDRAYRWVDGGTNCETERAGELAAMLAKELDATVKFDVTAWQDEPEPEFDPNTYENPVEIPRIDSHTRIVAVQTMRGMTLITNHGDHVHQLGGGLLGPAMTVFAVKSDGSIVGFKSRYWPKRPAGKRSGILRCHRRVRLGEDMVAVGRSRTTSTASPSPCRPWSAWPRRRGSRDRARARGPIRRRGDRRGFAEALGKMLALREAGHVPGAEHGVYPSGPHEGLPLWFWGRPEGVRGLPIIDDPRPLLLGVQRAVVDHDRRVVTYQGARPLEVYRSARKTGERIQGYRLDWLGPDPTARAQLELPVGVELERPE